MKTTKRWMSVILALAMVASLAACGTSVTTDSELEEQPVVKNNADTITTDQEISDKTDFSNEEENLIQVSDQQKQEDNTNVTHPNAEYNEGVVLIKVKESFDKNDLGTLEYISAEALYVGSKWYTVQLADAEKTEEAVAYLSGLDIFEKVDYDYVMGVSTESEANVTDNPNYASQTNLGLHNIPYGWTQNDKHPGGSPDVIVAVIDTGVDYNHLDLRNNIWTNISEVPDNGVDDDNNGYIDDVYGWDCVGDDNDPMDDNGHGTHVAGIIAAENNKVGGIGVAYNCKVMVLKAGNSSGYFNNSDIAEAIQYAYMNGASVINMSFGGSQISIAVEEALENAYNSCILVAAAGNDGYCNDLTCKTCDYVGVSYPAALPYVIGVMSTDANGNNVSSFSNYDHNPYNNIEYEVYAVGEGVSSCWPGNKYASLNGTSMAAPTVSGIAALLRSYYSDREVYSTKYIQSQIVNTGTVNPYNNIIGASDSAHSVADVYEAMTRIPKPEVNLYDYYIDDSTTISSVNNGNGVIDAGETVRLYISLHNRGGVATNVNVSIDTLRNGEFTDPYFTFVNNTIALSDIGTYSVRESGDTYFEIIVSNDCPNDYLVDFNIHYTYENGLDENDTVVYEDDGQQMAQFNVSRGFYLPAIITENTVYTADKVYIVGQDVVIAAGVTVTFEEGCEIQFYDDREYYNSPVITVYGTLIISGTQENMVFIYPNERNANYIGRLVIEQEGSVLLNYADCTNLDILDVNYEEGNNSILTNSVISNSYFKYHPCTYLYRDGVSFQQDTSLKVGSIVNSYIDMEWGTIQAGTINTNYIALDGEGVIVCPKANYAYEADLGGWLGNGKLTNNIVYTSVNKNSPNYSASRILDIQFSDDVSNNMFFSSDNSNIYTFMNIGERGALTHFQNNTFAEYFYQYASQVISDYYDASGNPTIDVYSSCSDRSLLWPHVVSIEMLDKDGNSISTVGREEIKVRVTFNRPMDTTKDTYLTFGTIEPYADYRIEGEYVSDTVWEGSYTLKAQIENGQNFLKVNNACAAEDATKTVFGEYQLHEFTIDTTEAMSMNLQAIEKDEGIELTWAQDDYDTLMGYNIYRSESKDGNYVKLNPAILLSTEDSFLDDNAEPGKTYWYTFTVVLSDFSESAPAGKVMATAKDTMAPSLYHTPVNQGYENNNLVITCTASDNVAITNVTLYYRTVGSSDWKTLSMVKQNDKYSATIFGSDVTLDGLEYYIIATDGINEVAKGSAEVPYTVVVKSADTLTRLGDVDGNGEVSTKDALMIMQFIDGTLILTDDQFKRANLNGDDILSSAEALRILQYINGKVTSLEM